MAAQREPHPDRLPIKLDSTSNGEFEPVPLGAARAPCARAGARGDRRRGAPGRREPAQLPAIDARCGGHARRVQQGVRRGRATRRPLRAARREPVRDDGSAGGARRRRVHLRRAAAPREPARRMAPGRRAQRVSRHAQQQLRQGRPRGVFFQRRAAEGRVLRQRHRDGRAVARAGRHGDQSARLRGRRRHTRGGQRARRQRAAAAARPLHADAARRDRRHGRAGRAVSGGRVQDLHAVRPARWRGGLLSRRRQVRHAVHRARAQARRAPHRRAQGPAVRPARLRILDLARHRPGGQAPPGHDVPDLPLGLRPQRQGGPVRRASQGRRRRAGALDAGGRQPDATCMPSSAAPGAT